MQNTPSPDKIEYWYVMLHLEPSVIDRQLLMMNEQRKAAGLSELLYVIPFRYLKKATPEKGMENDRRLGEIDDNNSLRDNLHDFVFIKATREEMMAVVNEPWNRDGRLHLHYYRSRYGRPIRVADSEMAPLIKLLVEQRQKFSFGPPLDNPSRLESVIIKTGLFRNYEASVMEYRHTSEGISMTLGIPVFNGEKVLRLPGYTASHVVMRGGLEQLLDIHFINRIEGDLLEILRRRVKRRETDETLRSTLKTLNDYSTFNYLQFDDTTAHNHFRGLMLLCATLRRDGQMKDEQIPVIKQLLAGTEEPTNDEEAFLMAILFIATHDADYRTAFKRYMQTHDVTSATLLELMPLVKEIRTR